MHYIKKDASGIAVSDGKRTRRLACSLQGYLDGLLLGELTTFEGRMAALRKRTGMKRNLPIPIDDTICLYPTKSLREPDVVCINYHRVLSIRDKRSFSEVIFKDLSILTVDMPYGKLARKHAKTACLLERLGYRTNPG